MRHEESLDIPIITIKELEGILDLCKIGQCCDRLSKRTCAFLSPYCAVTGAGERLSRHCFLAGKLTTAATPTAHSLGFARESLADPSVFPAQPWCQTAVLAVASADISKRRRWEVLSCSKCPRLQWPFAPVAVFNEYVWLNVVGMSDQLLCWVCEFKMQTADAVSNGSGFYIGRTRFVS